jgi:glycosyltransferase involved in cell wall biosynthesis
VTRVALCIPTCRRPAQLRRTLEAVKALTFQGRLRVVVCDNHRDIEGIRVCMEMAPEFPVPLDCLHEPAPGISQCRNTALREALSEPVDFIAMIDDDEWPAPGWLDAMLATQADHHAGVVFGPVEPHFECPPPAWATHGFFDAGLGLQTGNVLLQAEMLRRHGFPWFDDKLGLSGGEDEGFFEDLKRAGVTFATNAAATVYENVPPDRMRARYIFFRSVRIGNAQVLIERSRAKRPRKGSGALSKFGYALNHLFWSPRHPWRLFSALEDFGRGVGRITGRLGYRGRFYASVHPVVRGPGLRDLLAAFRREFRNGTIDVLIERSRGSADRNLPHELAKFGYALNHLAWSALQPMRLSRAFEDFGEGSGRIATILGYRRPAQRPRDLAARDCKENELSAPAVRTRHATVCVQCFGSRGDVGDALHYLTPGGSGVCDGVAFAQSRGSVADWVGIFTDFEHEIRLTMPPDRVFFAIGEPPTKIHQPLHVGQGSGTIVFTCDESLARDQPNGRRYILSPCMTRTWSVKRRLDDLRTSRVEGKPGRLSWITSDITLMDGHRDRMAFLARLRGKLEFDLYGRGFSPIDDKWNALAPYRYSIAFENTRAPYYFTEKLMDCFVAETMPIYVGSPAIGDFFPAESMITIEPNDPDVIAKIDDAVRSDLWRRNRDAVQEAKRRVLDDYNIFSRLARFVAEHGRSTMPPQDIVITPVFVDFHTPT